MKKGQGIIYQTESGEYGVALYNDQLPEFAQRGKVLLHLYTDPACTIRKLRIDKRQFNIIENISKLKQIGNVD